MVRLVILREKLVRFEGELKCLIELEMDFFFIG